MRYTEHFIFQDAAFKIYEVVENRSVQYSYRGQSEGIYSYECPHTFETRELAVYAAKLIAVWWSLDNLMLSACVEDLQNHELLLVNLVSRAGRNIKLLQAFEMRGDRSLLPFLISPKS